MAALQHWRPVNEAHAIQQVTARVRFSQPINDIPWRKIGDAARRASHNVGLLTEQAVEDVSLAMSPAGPQQVRTPSGTEFLRFERPDFYSDKFTVLRNEVAFEEWRYTRWAAFIDKLRQTLLPVGAKYIETVPVLGITLEYIDVFQAIEEDKAPDIREILRAPSEFIPPASFSPTEAFHCHTGIFERASSTTKRLFNVDIDVADSRQMPLGPGNRMLRVRTHVTDFFNQASYDALPEETFDAQFVAERFDQLHLILKEMLGGILTTEASNAVSLKG